MSIEKPNEFERMIEDYGHAVRDELEAIKARDEAIAKAALRTVERQAAWRIVARAVEAGDITPGIYRLSGRRAPNYYADGVLIQLHKDYPDLFPMFR